MTYSDSVRNLYALGNELKVGAKFGLDRIRTLLDALGNPERGQRFIHVAGTNGKGSTCAMIANVLRHAGLRSGLYSSPHLIEPTERIQIGGRPVSEAVFAQAFQTVHEAAERLIRLDLIDGLPSYFETITAMALLVFKQHCDVVSLEVGLGGRLDATNVVTPELCVITPVSFDHEVFLGSTLESIAAEKAGIIKPGVHVVSARQLPSAADVIANAASKVAAPLIRSDDAIVSDVVAKPDGSTFRADGVVYQCALAGRHQIENAITAISALKQIGIGTEAIQAGLGNVRWPGRLELVSRNPDFVLDGAHNPAGARALEAYVSEFCGQRPVWLVYGAMRDKALEEVTATLFPLADRVIATAPGHPRALRPEAILDLHEHQAISIAPTIAEAIAMAQEAPSEGIVFFTGSLYLVGEARALLLGKNASVA